MKNETTANVTNVATVEATATNAEIKKAARLETIAKALKSNAQVANALFEVMEVAQIENADGVALTLNKALQHLANVVQHTLGRKSQENAGELQEYARDIIDELGETVFLFGQIIEHYRAVDRLYKELRRAM